ncbi:MAG TPA: hypothetical protein VGO57_08205, partial [Verrucomicrobiae bacterium]
NTFGSADWWELKNFGATDINLTGYSWNDGSHAVQGADLPFDANNVVIHAGETIIITESNAVINSPAAFKQWWGAGVGSGVQIIVSGTANGLSKSGDGVRLWYPGANLTDPSDPLANAMLVDRVDVGAEPKTGIPTFIYDTNNGTFDLFSTNGVGGAFVAATSTDVGSPGIAPAASPIILTRQPGPANYTIPLNTPITYSISGYGLPKPKFQWLFNNNPLDTNALGAVIVTTISNNMASSTLTIPSVQIVDGGMFSVLASNGVQVVMSSNAMLNVTTTPSAPAISAFSPSTNLIAYVGQSITYAVSAYGSPTPAYQWQFNGTNISGQNGAQFQLYLSDTNQTGTYSVTLTNSAGSTNYSATLVVTPRPLLQITEVMASESTDTNTGDPSGNSDWWELSNFGNFPVNLQGYRFDDNHFSLLDADTITNNLIIQPGESIVLVEDMTPDQFRAWWGPQLRAGLQIITYPRIGFSATGDAITIWNAAATTEADYLDSISFSTATRGFSFGYDPTQSGDLGFLGYAPDGLSVAGVNGAFVAAVGSDVGSPGTVLNLPNFTSVTPASGGVALTWVTQPNWTNVVQFKNNLTDANWTTLTNLVSTGVNTLNFTDTTTNAPQRFYRIHLNLNQ